MDVKERNKQVKRILSSAFGSKNVSVTNGRGTAWGWCHIDIKLPVEMAKTEIINGDNYPKYTKDTTWLMNECERLANFLIKDCKFFNYTDDMNYDHSEVLIQMDFGG